MNQSAGKQVTPQTAVWVGLLLATACTVIVYWPGLTGPLLYDDMPNLGGVLHRGDLGFAELSQRYLYSNSGTLGRPVAMLSFIANALVNGADLWAWKLTNLVIHLVNGLLIFLLTRTVARRCAAGAGIDPATLGLLVAATWLLHPLHVSTVLYTVQRMAQLAALFQLLGLLLYLAGRLSLDNGDRRGWALMVLAIAGCLPAAVLSKENGLLLLFSLPLAELFLLATAPDMAARRRARQWLLLQLSACIALLLLAAWARPGLFTGAAFSHRPFTLEQRLLTETRVLVDYLEMTLLPRLSLLGFFHDGIPISSGWLKPPATLASGLFLLSLAVSALILQRRLPLYALGIGLFFIGHLIESTIIPLEIKFEHRQYLPAYGVLLAAFSLLVRLRLNRFVARTAVLLILIALGMQTAPRAYAWGDEWRMFAQMLKGSPDSPTLNVIVANRLADRFGLYDRARAMLAPLRGAAVQLNLAFIDCVEHGRIETDALQEITTPPIVSFYEQAGLINVGLAGLQKRCIVPDAAYIALLERWLKQTNHANPEPLYLYLAHYHYRSGQVDEAIAALEKGHRHDRRSPVTLFLAGHWLIDAGELDRAETYLQRGLEVNRDARNPHDDLVRELEARLRTARNDPEKLTPFVVPGMTPLGRPDDDERAPDNQSQLR